LETSPFTPRIKVISKRDAKATPKVIASNDITKLFQYLNQPAIKHSYSGCRNLALLSLALDGGPRLGELLSMQLEDLDLKRLRFNVRGKTGERTIIVSPAARNALQTYLDKFRLSQDTELQDVWLTSDGFKLSISGVQSFIARINKELNLHISAHKFRHTFVSTLINAGVSSLVVRELAGHSSVTTTQGYYASSDEALTNVQLTSSPLTLLGVNDIKRGRGRPKPKRA
jgi:site-specific recombinase XerD